MPTSEPASSFSGANAFLYRAAQSSRTWPYCTKSMNSAVSVSGTPMGPALVSAMMARSSEGSTTKFAAAPSPKAPEWLYSVRPEEVTPTLNP
ncbi:Uncharacterised protein [Mycobacterium tuberculosis]|uniref:Uncharacterized protein n=1 Tax=Mycobacterium tuberculosis TaxID=1773 RepID=A0A655AUQ8_MYCTX|nr:Uncharacterised protein [Mycobacterium tuberculosis]